MVNPAPNLQSPLNPGLDAARCALVLIDLQQGILGYARAPHSAETVLANARLLADRFHALGAPVVRVRVGWSGNMADALRQPADAPGPGAALPADWLDEPASLLSAPHDIQIMKRQWGAFYGTDLDLQLRRRGITTIVLGGIATPFGVESTARSAWEQNYAVVFAEDACGAPDEEMHRFALQYVFPRIGRVRSTAAVLEALPLAASTSPAGRG